MVNRTHQNENNILTDRWKDKLFSIKLSLQHWQWIGCGMLCIGVILHLRL